MSGLDAIKVAAVTAVFVIRYPDVIGAAFSEGVREIVGIAPAIFPELLHQILVCIVNPNHGFRFDPNSGAEF